MLHFLSPNNNRDENNNVPTPFACQKCWWTAHFGCWAETSPNEALLLQCKNAGFFLLSGAENADFFPLARRKTLMLSHWAALAKTLIWRQCWHAKKFKIVEHLTVIPCLGSNTMSKVAAEMKWYNNTTTMCVWERDNEDAKIAEQDRRYKIDASRGETRWVGLYSTTDFVNENEDWDKLFIFY